MYKHILCFQCLKRWCKKGWRPLFWLLGPMKEKNSDEKCSLHKFKYRTLVSSAFSNITMWKRYGKVKGFVFHNIISGETFSYCWKYHNLAGFCGVTIVSVGIFFRITKLLFALKAGRSVNCEWSLYHKGIQYNIHFDIKEYTGSWFQRTIQKSCCSWSVCIPFSPQSRETGVEDSLSGDKFIAINENWNYYFQWNNNARNVFIVLSFPQCRQCTMHHFSFVVKIVIKLHVPILKVFWIPYITYASSYIMWI